jgi:hypothetical protein
MQSSPRLQFKGTNVGYLILKILPPSPILRVSVVNAGSEFVEVLASRTEDGEAWEPIVPKAMLRTTSECKEGTARDRMRIYNTDNTLSKSATEGSWARVKVTCSCHENTMRLLCHLGSDGRQAQALMGLAQVRVWHSQEVFSPPVPPFQPTPTPKAEILSDSRESTASTTTLKPEKAKALAASSKASNDRVVEERSHSKQHVADASGATPAQTPPTSHKQTKPKREIERTKMDRISVAPASSSTFRGGSASQNIRKSLAATAAPPQQSSRADPIQQDLSKRLLDFVRALPPANLETASTKDAKSALMHYYEDWGVVYKKYKTFFKEKLEDLLNAQLEKYDFAQKLPSTAGLCVCVCVSLSLSLSLCLLRSGCY